MSQRALLVVTLVFALAIATASASTWTPRGLRSRRPSQIAHRSAAPEAQCAAGTWANGTNLSQAREWMSSASVSGKLLFAGGYTGGGFPSDVVDVLDVATMQWSAASLSEPRYLMATATLDPYAFFIGGSDSEGNPSDAIDVYNSTADEWLLAEPLTIAREGPSAAAYRDVLVICGGETYWNGAINVLNLCDFYNLTSGAHTSTNMTAYRARPMMTAVSHYLFIAGGVWGVAIINNVDLYDFNTAKWLDPFALHTGRLASSVAVFGNKVYLVGGTDSDYLGLDSIEVFDADTLSLTVLTETLSTPRFYMASAVVNGLALFAGGMTGFEDENGTLSAVVDVFDSCSGTWSTTTSLPLPVAFPGGAAATVTVGGKSTTVAVFAGGESDFSMKQTARTVAYTSTVQVSSAKHRYPIHH